MTPIKVKDLIVEAKPIKTMQDLEREIKSVFNFHRGDMLTEDLWKQMHVEVKNVLYKALHDGYLKDPTKVPIHLHTDPVDPTKINFIYGEIDEKDEEPASNCEECKRLAQARRESTS